ncbi:NAD-dependent epimerase/dehydratase family protein [Lichenihabitans sp. PAMC28606]|uniref:NAD-dependent epimerase/dehydratase family protein n=1 Tax=Lichenihabitans sp. PAMC28606 TaxID=2880932 RepID=UPI001D0A2AC9|nr:NAD-dependent epimerase/dehydratase family protein [Lichenihabitans sp. PAMC28606]UDL93793.1 NAD-dependent epimerase/dehydratase family protein [Lichenihabitans sp. PAMC28606]
MSIASSRKKILVTGAGGFIAHHLTTRLKEMGCWVRAADIKQPEYEATHADEFMQVDLRDRVNCAAAVEGMDEVYHLAADMGGIGYISQSHAEITLNNTLIDVGMVDAAHKAGVSRFLYSSSACVYPQFLQHDANVVALKEEDAFPAAPEEGYGLEKLYTEKLCQYFTEDFGMATRVVRFHNVYGPLGTYDGGREKAPAAISRKIAKVLDGDMIDIWGDGEQTRSFMYIDDCVEGLVRIMKSDYSLPLNLGTDELVTINQLVDIVAEAAGKRIRKSHDTTRPQGVRGRNSDNTRLRDVLGWEPKIDLRTGIVPTYTWIAEQLSALDKGSAQSAYPLAAVAAPSR